ncbi:MAG TPA: hypothetical protein VHO04_00360 [Sphingopyxis sp.]|uniref:hypothetical protein n=1 Tax=Sphingopyxis sp. TaxID=1908224 RepID=UPI002E3621D0|nr:hypothetical protein [Sphingopyxis sp.]HEX2811104.1 hypothetical protein [Sphingopyxis sp.]
MVLLNRPLLTLEYPDASQFRPEPSALYLFGARSEDRSRNLEVWRNDATDLDVIEISADGTDGIRIVSDGNRRVALRDFGELQSIFEGKWGRPLYLDITGLSNHVWPAILKTVEGRMPVNVMYVEPVNYAYSPSPRENVFFDLSELIIGISPIPQFSNLYEPEEDHVTLVPLLGFEGARFTHLLEEVQPPGDNIEPIIGVPGFRAEYPFFTYQGNQIPLKNSGAYKNVRFAKANCPFSVYYSLLEVVASYPAEQFFKIGLIGTKPHALGAVLFCLTNPDRVELIYDHTKQLANRSSGLSRCLVYEVSAFLDHMRSVS